MSGNVIERDGNLVKVDFTKKSGSKINLQNREMSPLATAAITAIVAPALMTSAVTPFLDDNKNRTSNDERGAPNELRLTALPDHTTKSPRDLINEFKEKSQGGGYVCKIEERGNDSGKSR